MAAWAGQGWHLELRHPCGFSSQKRAMVDDDWWSVSSRLDPDVALLSRTDVGPRCVLIDAKDRPRLTPGDLAREASKYLWGIRRGKPSVMAVNAVILVSPYGGDEPFDRANAKQWSWHAHPHAPPFKAPGEVGTDLCSASVRDLLEQKLLLPPAAFALSP